MFPLAVKPEAATEAETGRGPDTVNRLLLHGARYHDRKGAFLNWAQGRQGSWSWTETPDWRADRHAIRVALVLRERLQVAAGDTVAVWSGLGMVPAIVERGIWSIGAVSVPVWPEWELKHVANVLADARPEVLFAPDQESAHNLNVIGGLPESVRATILLAGTSDDEEGNLLPFETFMDYGGVLDTAERAAMWRTSAKSIKPGDLATIEYTVESGAVTRRDVDHATMVRTMEALSTRFPPTREGIHLLTDDRPGPMQRALLYTGWADGLTMTAFAASPEAREQVSTLRPVVVACREAMAGPLLEMLRGPAAAAPEQHSDLAGSVGAGVKRRISVFVTDSMSGPLDAAAGEEHVEYVQPADLDVPRAGGRAAVTPAGGP